MTSAYTPTEKRIVRLLADGEPHPRREIFACLPDELGALSNIQVHLSRIRKRLRPCGMDIVCVIHQRRICYQQVKRLAKTRRR